MSTQTNNESSVAEKTKYIEPTKFNILVHNNDLTSFQEVIFIVSHVFNKTEEESWAIADNVNNVGKGLCGTYDQETADAKLHTVEMAKQYLIQQFPDRVLPIKILKFTKEEVK